MELSDEEKRRYNRHIILDKVGPEGQLRLKQAKVMVIGAGGLGCPILQYLAAAGVGTLGIIDDDEVDVSNLQRQVLFDMHDVGLPKASVAARKLAAQNPHIAFEAFTERLHAGNALKIVRDYDLIIDGTDNFPTRYLINDACVMLDKPFVFGSIFKFEGQVSVFNYEGGPTYRCLFPSPPGAGEVPNCAQIGVIGVLPGMIGTIQANEAIKIITGIGPGLNGKLLLLNTITMEQTMLQLKRSATAGDIAELIDYEAFCGVVDTNEIRTISVAELQERQDSTSPATLLDVREAEELEICKLDAIHVPLSTLEEHVSRIPRDEEVVVYCHHGMRSAHAIGILQKEYGFNNLVNLEGGIHAWAAEADPAMATY